MDTKLYLTIAAIIALLYTLTFLVIPENMSVLFSGFVEPHATLNLRFLGGANLVWGLILWFARDWVKVQVRLAAVAETAIYKGFSPLSSRRLLHRHVSAMDVGAVKAPSQMAVTAR
jgi:hypothetical protein